MSTQRNLIPKYSWWTGDDRMFVVIGLYFQGKDPKEYELLEVGKTNTIRRKYQELQDLVVQGTLKRWD